MAKLSASEIKNYIKLNSTDASNQKGYVLYMSNSIEDVTYLDGGNNITAKVLGSMLYRTSVFLLSNGNIITSCTCPYDYSGICKHRVALLYYIAGDINSNTIDSKQIPITKQPSVTQITQLTSEPKEILNYKNLNLQNLTSLYNNHNYFLSTDPVKNTVVHDNKASFLYHEWENFIDVDFWLEENKLFTTCQCNKMKKGICVHQASVLKKIVSDYPKDFFKNLKPQNIHKLKKEACKKYGFPSDENYFHFFDIQMINNELIAIPSGDAKGLVPLDNAVSAKKMLIPNEELLSLNQQAIESNLAIGYVFKFGKKFDYYNFIELIPITGKLNSNKLRLLNPIRKLEEQNAENIYIDDENLEILKLAALTKPEHLERLLDKNNLRYSKNYQLINSLVAKYYKSTLLKIREFLANKPFVYSANTNSLTSTDLKELNFSNEAVSVYFRVNEDLFFYNLELIVKLGELEIPITNDELIYHAPLLLEYKNVLYLIESKEDASLISENILERTNVKTVKTNFKSFFNDYLKPISQKNKINFDTHSVNFINKEANEMKKQLYISELGKFVLFKPYVQYNNETLINILEYGSIIELKENQIIETFRNKEFEKEYYQFFKSLHEKFENQFNENFFHIDFDEFVKNQWFLKAFEALSKFDVEVFGLKDLKNFKYSQHSAKVIVNVSSGQDWFDVEMNVSFGNEQVSLKDIKKALVKKENFVKLSDGKLGILPEEWLLKFEKYFRQGQVKKDTVKISKLRFSVIDELFDEKDYLEIYKEIAEKRNALKNFTQIKKLHIPKELKGELRDYQKEGFHWLNFLDEFKWGGILADDMGLGKTIQILTFLLKNSEKKNNASLVILPTSLLFNWENEINKFAPSLTYFFHYGINRLKDTKVFEKYDIVLTTYGTLTRDVAVLQDYKFNYVILDESQAIKNPLSQRFKAVSLLKANNRIAMTGTPIENNTFDLYAQMEFLNPGFLGSQKQFKENYSDAIDRDQNPVIAAELQKLINPFILRRTKEQVATELPPKTEDYLYCEMEDEQRKVYEAFKNKYRDLLLDKIDTEGMGNAKMAILEGLTKLRQICDSPEILPDKENYGKESIKIKELLRHIKNKTGKHKILLFSQFVKMLSIVKRELKREKISFEYLDGKSSQKQREESVEHFQNDETCRVFLISLKAGGTGLNLTAADYVYIIDPWWNPAVENQAIDRCYRIGQDKKVIAYRMICKDTLEEKIMIYQAKKQKIASEIISTDENFVKQLDRNSILDLFG